MGFFDFFGGGDNKYDPAADANKYIGQIPGMERQAYDPYIQRGQQAGDILGTQFGAMASDPTAYINKMLEGYAPSRGYQMEKEEMSKAAANAAAAGGMRGSGADIENQARISDRLMGQDMQQWLQNVMGAQRTGLGGEQGLYGTGFQATGREMGDISNVLGTQGQLAFQGDREKMQQEEDRKRRNEQLFGSLLGAAGAGLGSFMGGAGGGSALSGSRGGYGQGPSRGLPSPWIS